MSVTNNELEHAIDLKNYLGIETLPKYFVDDIRLEIDTAKKSDDEVILQHFREDSLHGIKTARFLKDFYHYKAVPDITTKNESFRRTAELFRLQGIKNYYFILQVNNPALIGVDPRDEANLTNEQKVWIHNECKENFWYCLREVMHLKADAPFKANRGNVSFIWTYLNHVTTYNIMPRQQGKAQDVRSKIRVKQCKPNDPVWKYLGDIKTGDIIIDPHGNESQVNGYWPQGFKRTYEVEMSDGRKTKACTEHMWRYRTNKECGEESWSETTTAYMLELLKDPDYKQDPIQIPLIENLENSRKERDGLGYLVGALLSVKGDNQYIPLPNVELTQQETLQALLDRDSKARFHVKVENDQLVICKSFDDLFHINNETGLPVNLLDSNLETRTELLHGILDNIGDIGHDGIIVNTKDTIVMRQIQYLVRGLGGTARFIKKINKLIITLPESIPYFRFRKEDHPVYPNKLFVKKITYSGDRECVCIEVDNEDSTYITDDFIVTHNTVSVQVIDFWLTYIMGRSYKTHLVTLKSDNRAQFIEAIKNIRTQMPNYIVNPTYKDKDSGTYLTYRSFGEGQANVLTISVPQQSEAAAGDLGRGLTVGTTNFDEPGYINYIESIVNGCTPSALTEMENMREKGLPYAINYITTPNTIKHPSGAYMYKNIMNSTEWRESFFDCYSESHLVYKLIKRSPVKTTSPAVAMIYNYLKLGKSKDWVQRTIDQLKLTLSKAKIDLLLMWVEDGEDRLFDDITREALSDNKKDALWSKEYRDSNLFIDFFVSKDELVKMCGPDYNDHILIGADTSSAINKDACTLVLRSMATGDVVGVGRYPLAFLEDVADITVDLLETIHNSTLVIERNYAHHFIDKLLITLQAKGMDPFQKIFNRIYQDPVKYAKEFEEIKRSRSATRTKEFYLRYKEYFGFNTTASSRKELYDLIQECVGNTGAGIHYDKLIDEIIALKIKNDRIDHELDGHDDLVIAWLLTYWFIKRGNSKTHYGINSHIALTRTKNLLGTKQHSVFEDPKVVDFMDKIRQRLVKLTEEYIKTNDNILAMRLEYEINKLSKMLPKEVKRIHTIDSVIENAKVERNQRIMKRKAA